MGHQVTAGRCLAREKPLHQGEVQPFAKFFAGFRQNSDRHKPQGRMERNRGGIYATHACNHAVAVDEPAPGDQFRQKVFPNAVSLAVPSDVNRVFYGEAITFTWPEGRGISEADNVALKLRYQVGQALIQDSFTLPLHGGFSGRHQVESRCARLYKMRVDRSHSSYVGGHGIAHQTLGSDHRGTHACGGPGARLVLLRRTKRLCRSLRVFPLPAVLLMGGWLRCMP
jgi:hypothetical protein